MKDPNGVHLENIIQQPVIWFCYGQQNIEKSHLRDYTTVNKSILTVIYVNKWMDLSNALGYLQLTSGIKDKRYDMGYH